MLAGFDQPDSGEIRLNGRDLAGVEPEKRPVHTVFQSYALFPHMSVAQNIAFPLKMAGVAKSEIDARVEQALKDVRLADKGGRMPTQLRRPAPARGDRPRAGQPAAPAAARRTAVGAGRQAARRNADRTDQPAEGRQHHLRLCHPRSGRSPGAVAPHRGDEPGPGGATGRPETIYSFPRSRFVADFIGQCNLLDATVEAVDGERVRIDLRAWARSRR